MNDHYDYDNFWKQKTLAKLQRFNLLYNHNYEWPTILSLYTIDDITLSGITTTIETREQNYKLSPTKLLNSILERKLNKINLSKIVIQDQNLHENILITDLKTIEQETILHFQIVGNTSRMTSKSIYLTITDLPQQWQNIYQQKSTPINEQELLLTPITRTNRIIKIITKQQGCQGSRTEWPYIRNMEEISKNSP
ncbi:hypothetical protein RclHR1_03520026 [Rhizophagus clarus]|uniref:Uncharacterized protein n=1 Tax=Rhizophagus clarus TaxID=94130 RepID=A0A2Z6S5F4_9GLOM|nr:hypothetical protein RclHR1_03520026 [Rhizophagus clarus]